MSIQYLDLEELLEIAVRVLGQTPEVRDLGLLDAAAHRPRASAFGADAYPDVHTKAAALLDSMERNHALIDGNRRLGWMACYTFYALNGFALVPREREAFAFVKAVADGQQEIAVIAKWLAAHVEPASE